MDQISPGRTSSLWIETTAKTDYPQLDKDIDVDVAVIGGGMVGLTAGCLLQNAGLKVAVFEATRIAEGVTGHTTAKITSLHGRIYEEVENVFGEAGARTYGQANQAAIEQVAELIRTKSIACDFTRTRAYTYTEDEDQVEALRKEAQIAAKLGLPASFTRDTPLPFDIEGAVIFDNQAQFHPRKYLLGLAEDITSSGGLVFEDTLVSDIVGREELRLETGRAAVTARHVIVATHFPFYDKGFFYARMFPTRGYLMALRLQGDPPPGAYYFSRGEKVHSLRDHRDESGAYLLVGGGEHKSGHVTDTLKFYLETLDYAAKRFPVESVAHYWSTEDYQTFDQVPYIGPSPNSDRIYVATGMGGWGMSGGALAAMIISDSIQNKPNKWRDFFSPTRMGVEAVKKAAGENAHIMKMFFKEKLEAAPPGDAESLQPGEGSVVHLKGRKRAVCKTIDGRVHVLKPHCTHMGCAVSWNNAEQTWDCPCHGSVFAADGSVIHGPALRPLDPLGQD